MNGAGTRPAGNFRANGGSWALALSCQGIENAAVEGRGVSNDKG